MKFGKQDAVTFVIGLLAAMTFVLGEAFIDSASLTEDPGKWAIGLGTGLMSATGRYLVTELLQRGFVPRE